MNDMTISEPVESQETSGFVPIVDGLLWQTNGAAATAAAPLRGRGIVSHCRDGYHHLPTAMAEATTEKTARLSRLAGQAFNQKNVSRGERFLQEALDTAEGVVTSHDPEAFGEYPHVL